MNEVTMEELTQQLQVHKLNWGMMTPKGPFVKDVEDIYSYFSNDLKVEITTYYANDLIKSTSVTLTKELVLECCLIAGADLLNNDIDVHIQSATKIAYIDSSSRNKVYYCKRVYSEDIMQAFEAAGYVKDPKHGYYIHPDIPRIVIMIYPEQNWRGAWGEFVELESDDDGLSPEENRVVNGLIGNIYSMYRGFNVDDLPRYLDPDYRAKMARGISNLIEVIKDAR